jgi:hypothetical protein
MRFLSFLGLILLLSGCQSFERPRLSDFYTETELADMKYCEVDDDCVEVDLNCGSCYCYGSAYNLAYADELRDLDDALCLGYVETEDLECALDCPYEVPRCIDNTCTMASPQL